MSTATRTPATARGRATRERIVAAAARLMYDHGVAGTSLDDVRGATSTSKSQLYHYFADKSDARLCGHRLPAAAVLTVSSPSSAPFDTWAALRAWRDHVVP